jgi:hypothetical protein
VVKFTDSEVYLFAFFFFPENRFLKVECVLNYKGFLNSKQYGILQELSHNSTLTRNSAVLTL